MKRTETRYKRVWDGGYEAAMADANRILADAIDAGVAFSSSNPPAAWDTDMIAVRLGDRITLASREVLIQIIDHQHRRAAA